MVCGELFYQVVSQLRSGSIIDPKLSDSVQGTTAAINLIRSSIPFGGWSDSTRVGTELEKLTSQIGSKMPDSGGVLVCVGIEETKKGSLTTRSLLGVHIAGSASDARRALQSYFCQSHLVQGPSKGGIRKDIYLWVTTTHSSEIPPYRVKIRDQIIDKHQIIRRAVWGTQAPKYQKLTLDWNYKALAIHHSGDYGNRKDPVSIEDLHMNGNGWDDVGYHYLIHPGGSVYEGREIVFKGSHIDQKNTGKIGILMLGDYDEQWWDIDDELSGKHLSKLKSLISTLKTTFPTIQTLGGHREFISQKEGCPGNLLINIMNNLRQEFTLNAP